MARPKLDAHRKSEILDAFEACIIRHGVDAVTLNDIAASSKLSRPLVRHHGGNKGQLIVALVERFMRRTLQSINQLSGSLPEVDRVEILVDLLFDEQEGYRNDGRLAGQFLIFSNRDVSLTEKMNVWTSGFLGFLILELQQQYPYASKMDVGEVSQGLAALFLTSDLPTSTVVSDINGKDLRNNAVRLVRSLES